jgi:hypothetical protein
MSYGRYLWMHLLKRVLWIPNQSSFGYVVKGNLHNAGLQIEGVLAYFTHLKHQKRRGLTFLQKKKIVKMTPDTFYPTYYAKIWLQMT